MTDDELAAWVQGYLAGYDRGHDEGHAAGMRQYDAELVAALSYALGGPGCTSRRDAVRRHERAVDRKRRREAADRGAAA